MAVMLGKVLTQLTELEAKVRMELSTIRLVLLVSQAPFANLVLLAHLSMDTLTANVQIALTNPKTHSILKKLFRLLNAHINATQT